MVYVGVRCIYLLYIVGVIVFSLIMDVMMLSEDIMIVLIIG